MDEFENVQIIIILVSFLRQKIKEINIQNKIIFFFCANDIITLDDR